MSRNRNEHSVIAVTINDNAGLVTLFRARPALVSDGLTRAGQGQESPQERKQLMQPLQ